jgi:hypothetical protein
MLKRIKVRNFQRIKKLNVEIDKYVTIFVGRNGVGKSGFIRALRWLALNKPTGKRYIRWGAKRASVELHFGKHILKREAGGRLNTYTIDDKVLKAIRSGVPAEVSKLLRMNDIHFQRQHENAFWFSLTPGQVTKELNKLVDLQTIDQLQAHLAKQLRETKVLLKDTQSRVRTERKSCRSLRWILRVAAQFEPIPPLLGGIAAGAAGRARLALLWGLGSRQAPRHRNAAAAATGAVAGGCGAAAIRDAGDQLARLGAATGRLGAAGGRLSVVDGLLGVADPPEPPDSKLSAMIDSGLNILNDIDLSSSKIKRRKIKLEEKLGGRCPSCGGFLSDQTLI